MHRTALHAFKYRSECELGPMRSSRSLIWLAKNVFLKLSIYDERFQTCGCDGETKRFIMYEASLGSEIPRALSI
jgi:hypothetical protein